MIKVGVTGGIGSGKTEFCKTWEKLGAFVLYADDFAKKLMVTEPELIEALKNAFGEETYRSSGELNKAHLITEAFDKGRVEELNRIVHPVLRQKSKEVAEQAEQKGYELFAKEAAVLLNEGRPPELDYIVMLLSEKEDQLKRVSRRDQTEKQAVLERMNKQPDFESLTHLADFIIRNNEGLEELHQKAAKLYRKLISPEN